VVIAKLQLILLTNTHTLKPGSSRLIGERSSELNESSRNKGTVLKAVKKKSYLTESCT
jgi:hypothetical protein